jgi:hypothetical protein
MTTDILGAQIFGSKSLKGQGMTNRRLILTTALPILTAGAVAGTWATAAAPAHPGRPAPASAWRRNLTLILAAALLLAIAIAVVMSRSRKRV